jgi:hypothetical protein
MRRSGSGSLGGRRSSRSSSAPSIRVTQARPAASLPTTHGGHDQLGRGAGQERQRAESDRAVRAADPVVVLDAGEERDRLVDRDARGDATAGEPDALADEQVAVAAGDVVEVDVVAERDGDRAHVQSRVPRSSCVRPPESWWWEASEKPARRSIATISAGSGR